MDLIALEEHEREMLKHWLHYVIRKMEFRISQGATSFGIKEGLPILKRIQEQVLHPKKKILEHHEEGLNYSLHEVHDLKVTGITDKEIFLDY